MNRKGRRRRRFFIPYGWIDVFKLLIAALFFPGLYLLNAPRPALYGYVGMSVVAFIAYAVDKRRSKKGGWRTPEATLHWIEFLGGWPGAVPAQLLFRHKTRKSVFQITFWAIVAAHIGFWVWLYLM